MRTLTPQQTAALEAMPETFLAPQEAAFLLGIGVRSLWRLAAKGQLPAPARFSRKLVRFSRRELLAFMRRHVSPSRTPATRQSPAAAVNDAGPVFLIRDFKTGEKEFYRPARVRPAFTEAS
jgi:excisionase family DNA binding protein